MVTVKNTTISVTFQGIIQVIIQIVSILNIYQNASAAAEIS